MADLTRIESLPEGAIASAVRGAMPLDGRMLARDAPQECWVLRSPGGQAEAQGSIWWRDTPLLDGDRIGTVGHYAASNDGAAARLLEHLIARLGAEGCSIAVGPMDSSTWKKYRLVVERTADPPFLLDLDNPDDWPGHFRNAGFHAIAEYRSTMVDDTSIEDARVERVADRLHGIMIRPLNQARMDDELRAIHKLSLVAFENAFLQSPITEPAFLSLYRPLIPRIDPRLVLLAEDERGLAGYVFAIPDLNEPERGAPLRTLVVKTLAVLPDRAYAGLGALLLARVHRNARSLGLHRAVHALMHVSNKSRALSEHWHARPIRRYELFARTLTQ